MSSLKYFFVCLKILQGIKNKSLTNDRGILSDTSQKIYNIPKPPKSYNKECSQ